MHLWSCHWEGKPPPPTPPASEPNCLQPLGLFWCWKSELIVVQARWQWGLHHHPAPHPIFSPSDHFKGPTGNRHIEKNLELPLSLACEIFLRAIEVSRGKKRLLFSRNPSWPPRLWGVAAQHRFFSSLSFSLLGIDLRRLLCETFPHPQSPIYYS